MAELVVLLDDGGVLNDNALRAGQWQQLVAEFFVPILGGRPEAWKHANRVVTDRMFAQGTWDALLNAAADYASFERLYYREWLGGMCELVGLPRPTGQQCIEFGESAEDFITPHIHAACPGAVEAVQALRADGYELHTASGESSSSLAMYLDAMGIRDCFGRLYGPDLIDTFKNGPVYYERLLADLDLPPEKAIFVDDSPKALSWAAQAGARTVLVGRREGATTFQQVGSLAELPQILHTLGDA